jgi:adenylate cyclase
MVNCFTPAAEPTCQLSLVRPDRRLECRPGLGCLATIGDEQHHEKSGWSNTEKAQDMMLHEAESASLESARRQACSITRKPNRFRRMSLLACRSKLREHGRASDLACRGPAIPQMRVFVQQSPERIILRRPARFEIHGSVVPLQRPQCQGSIAPIMKRRLIAVLAADVVGYSRLTESHEEVTVSRLMRLRTEVVNPGIAGHGGILIKNTGDGFLAMFDSVHDAADCAIALQNRIMAETADQPPEQRISFRMAINVADAIVEDNDIYGDGVNIAARLQAYSEPGGVVVSGAAAEQIGSAMALDTIDLGELHLRNLSRPVRVFALRLEPRPARLIGDAPVGAEARPSIAVLPFRKYLAGQEDSYFADGIVDDIIRALGTLKELFVISRGSTLGYSGTTIDVRAIGRELGVRYVLYGSVSRSGERLRIGTELSDAETGAIIQADKYDGTLDDLFALQDRISISVAKAIAPHVRERELLRAMRKHPQNMTAYDLVLQGLDMLYRMDRESFSRARGLLQQAIAHDPGYAPAYSYIAYWYVFRVGEHASLDPEDAAAGARYAEKAIELDANDAMALAIYGHVQSFLLKKYDVAIAHLDRAIEAGPSLAMAWTMSSATCGYIGDGRNAVIRAEQGVRLSPLDALTFWHEGILAQAHYINGDYEQAVAWARQALARNEAIRFTSRTLIASLAALGQTNEAAEEARKLLSLQPDFRLGPYATRCPFKEAILGPWIARLRSAGLPD